MKMFLPVFTFLGLLLVGVAQAEEKSPWSHESEASVVQVTGNTESESYSAKQKTSYTFDANALIATGRYLQTKASGTETAKSWEAAIRYERALSDLFSIYLQHGAESDVYAGYTQRDNTDLGGKYHLIKTEEENLLAEAGFRHSKIMSSVSDETSYVNYGRFYSEYSRKINSTLSAKAWVEYLPNFKDSEAYLVNYEGSVTAMMTQIFSLKTAYLVKYHNKTVLPDEKKEDKTLTVSLVAKF